MTAPAAIFVLFFCASADTYYEQGMALARLERWDEARAAFERGREQDPSDPRFTLELAGIAFKQQNYSEAKRNLRIVLRRNPADRYANDFLATLYQLDGNTEAALSYWNRIGKPRVEQVRIDPPPKLDPVLLDRAFVFAPASQLELRDFLSTEARLQFLEMFPSQRLDLVPRPEGDFDVLFHASERGGPGELLSALRGAPYETITPQLATRSGLRLDSLARWDKQKRRALVSISGPIARSASLRYRFFADGRNENWILRGLNLRRADLGAEVRSRQGARWGWSSGAEISRRWLRGFSSSDPLFQDGWMLKYRATADLWLVRAPERRFTLLGAVAWESGRATRAFSKAAGSLIARWFPLPRGDSLEVETRLGAGDLFGHAPFDELFILGLERDNDLWMRAHIGTRDGKKGAAPMGGRYGLLNWEASQTVYQNGLLKVKLGPFFDSGRVAGEFGSGRWMWDAGLQCKLSVLGVGVTFSYGKDLHSGSNAYYFR